MEGYGGDTTPDDLTLLREQVARIEIEQRAKETAAFCEVEAEKLRKQIRAAGHKPCA